MAVTVFGANGGGLVAQGTEMGGRTRGGKRPGRSGPVKAEPRGCRCTGIPARVSSRFAGGEGEHCGFLGLACTVEFLWPHQGLRDIS
jgi:hypothetical protein